MINKGLFLYHFPLDPFCRKVRLTLLEKGMPVQLVLTKPWERDPNFLQVNPLGTIPVLYETDGHTLSGHQAVAEYLNEIQLTPNLLGETPRGRAEIRRLTQWFDGPFYQDVVYPIMLERLLKVVWTHEAPDPTLIRAGRENLQKYLKYIDWLAGRRSFLGGRNLSFADLAGASHLSVLDYLGELNWQGFPDAALWYAKIKSRPTFAPILDDQVAGILPSPHYGDLDF